LLIINQCLNTEKFNYKIEPLKKIQFPPKILLVVAHPDDEAICAATIYKVTQQLGGTADLALFTNGEGGYQYATLAEKKYGLQLTDETIGRAYLPAIRKRELLASGAIIGFRNYFFLEQTDNYYTENATEILDFWATDYCIQQLNYILARESYDFVFVMLPFPKTHAHHQCSAIITLEVIKAMPVEKRPIVLASFAGFRGPHTYLNFKELPNYPITKIRENAPIFQFDKLQTFGHKNRLNYNIIVSWAIAEHKTQGTMQLLLNKGELEYFWFFDLNEEQHLATVEAFFEWVNKG